MNRKVLSILALILITLPEPTLAALIPCNGPDCSACDIVTLANSLLVWLIGILFIIFAIIATMAGFGMVTSGGNPQALSDAKSKLTNALIGIIIVLAAWLLVDTVMQGLLKGTPGEITGYGPWSAVQCQTQTIPQPAKTPTNNLSSPGYRACPESLDPNAPTQRVTVYQGTGTLPNCATILANPTSYTTATTTPTWTTSNPLLARVSPNGTITTYPENWSGFDSAIITATYPDGSVAKTLVVGGQAGTPGTTPTPGKGNTCHVGNGISFCKELPLGTKSDDTIPLGGKGVYHFKVDPGEGYSATVVGIATVDGGKGVNQLYLGISETPGESRSPTGERSGCFSGPTEWPSVTFLAGPAGSYCTIQPGVDYYVTVENLDFTQTAGIRISTNQVGPANSPPPTPVAKVCRPGGAIESCHELPLGSQFDDSLDKDKKAVYHFKIGAGDAAQGYGISLVGIADAGGGLAGRPLYVGISETPGDTRWVDGKNPRCYGGPGEEPSLSFHTNPLYTSTCVIQPDVDYYFTIENVGTGTAGTRTTASAIN